MAPLDTATRGGETPMPTTTDDPVRGLPAWTYRNAELLDLEYQRVILGSWQIACHANDVRQPGDYFVLELMRDSVLVLRGDDGVVRAFANVCRHRGSKLLDGTGNCPKAVVCPYHGWAYELDGRLKGVPSERSFPGLDKATLGLREIELEVFFGFVFVRVARPEDHQGPDSVAETWGDFAEHLKPYRLEEMERIEFGDDMVWDANWKVGVDNNLENYHIPLGHPGYHRMLDNQMEGFENAHGVAGSISTLKQRPSSNWVERMYQKLAPTVLAAYPEQLRKQWLFFTMPPNIGLDFYPDCVDYFQILPLGPTRCQVRYGIYGHKDERREMRLLRYLNYRINGKVGEEDRWLSERVQQGLASHGYDPGPLSRIESSLRLFHQQIREACPVASLDEEPLPGTVRQRDAELLAAE
ncbi:Phenylpropionate dioxygenase, large terminal subunit [Tistlia consotensis]|uniref:Phenylpropionate dioxygenase, large terminal subunit n=2 Tax=Tistlia TaxID=1321364 RepID=A0A1Y6BJC6_9PROT|nr:Phenylpropionate dioxygenase, large terminal subunit [Tistlia consotensis USBA 355]SNR49961.1 Phenylpropionate dioxygenase, large terminal subunit [Tistlia consotensis]